MATHRIPILGFNTLPDASGNVFFEPYSVKATNDIFRHGHFIFNDTATRDLLYGAFNVPKNYVGTASVVIVWTTTAITGNVVWDFDYRTVAGDDAASLDQATVEEAVTVTDAAPSATDERMEVSIALTSANFAADETAEFLIARDGAGGPGTDTIAAAVQLVGLYFQYNDA